MVLILNTEHSTHLFILLLLNILNFLLLLVFLLFSFLFQLFFIVLDNGFLLLLSELRLLLLSFSFCVYYWSGEASIR